MTDPLSPDTGGHADIGGHAGAARAAEAAGRDPAVGPAGLPPLPDLSEVDLATLRTLDHPVLTDMVADLCERAERPREMLWGFTSSL